MGVYFDAEHDHKAVDEEKEDKDEVGDVSEGSPDRKEAGKTVETKTFLLGVLGIGWLYYLVSGHVVSHASDVLTGLSAYQVSRFMVSPSLFSQKSLRVSFKTSELKVSDGDGSVCA